MTTTTVRLARVGPVGPEDFVRSAGGQLVQVCRAVVAIAEGGEWRVTLFMQADPAAPPLTFVSLATAASGEAAGAISALLLETDGGKVVAQTEAVSGEQTLPIAAAAAVMRASWAWDESQMIEVVVDGSPVRIAPKFTGDEWQATEIATDAV